VVIVVSMEFDQVAIATSSLLLQSCLMFRGNLAPSYKNAVATLEKQIAHDSVESPFKRTRDSLAIALPNTARNESFIEAVPQAPRPVRSRYPRIAIKTNGRIVLIPSAEILVVESEGDYVRVQRYNGTHLLREHISVLADKLQAYGFIRVHRCLLVNAAHVESIEPRFNGDYLLRMKGGKVYNATRTYKKNLRLLADLWIGVDGFD